MHHRNGAPAVFFRVATLRIFSGYKPQSTSFSSCRGVVSRQSRQQEFDKPSMDECPPFTCEPLDMSGLHIRLVEIEPCQEPEAAILGQIQGERAAAWGNLACLEGSSVTI